VLTAFDGSLVLNNMGVHRQLEPRSGKHDYIDIQLVGYRIPSCRLGGLGICQCSGYYERERNSNLMLDISPWYGFLMFTCFIMFIIL